MCENSKNLIEKSINNCIFDKITEYMKDCTDKSKYYHLIISDTIFDLDFGRLYISNKGIWNWLVKEVYPFKEITIGATNFRIFELEEETYSEILKNGERDFIIKNGKKYYKKRDKMSNNYKIYGDNIEEKALEQFNTALEQPQNVKGALMPDAHVGYVLPIGAVIKSTVLFPSYVGYDIGCGVTAIKLKTNKKYNKQELEDIKKQILKIIPVGVSRHHLKQDFDNKIEGTKLFNTLLNNIGAYQLGTLGGGNHFIEIGIDKDNQYWIIVHSGSRNVGYKLADYYMKIAATQSFNKDKYIEDFDSKNKEFFRAVIEGKTDIMKYEDAKKVYINKMIQGKIKPNIEDHYFLDPQSEIGQDYLKDLKASYNFAMQNRKRIIDTIVKIMNVETSDFINNSHNHIEEVDSYYIHRKGATPAGRGMYGVIPGNMRDGSFIVEGKGNEDSLYSSSHGAGRVFSRRQAKENINYKDLQKEMSNIVNNINNSTIDEAPEAYKDIFKVMDLQHDLVDIITYIKPILSLKG